MRSSSEIIDIFNTFDIMFLVFTDKKDIFSYLLRGKLTFFPSHFSLILLGSARLVDMKLGENGLKYHFNTWIKRNLRFKKIA